MKNDPSKPLKVLVVGQIPPPYNGQAMMIQRLVNAQLEGVRIYHIKMSFSNSLQSIYFFRDISAERPPGFGKFAAIKPTLAEPLRRMGVCMIIEERRTKL